MTKRWLFLLALCFASSALASKPLTVLGEGDAKLESLAKKQHSGEVLTKQEQQTWDEFQQDLFNYDMYRDNIEPFCSQDVTDVARACESLTAEETKELYADGDQGQIKMYYQFPVAERIRMERELHKIVKKWAGQQ